MDVTFSSKYAKTPTSNFRKVCDNTVGSIICILLEIYFSFQHCKNFENPLRIDKVIAMSLVNYFLGTQCTMPAVKKCSYVISAWATLLKNQQQKAMSINNNNNNYNKATRSPVGPYTKLHTSITHYSQSTLLSIRCNEVYCILSMWTYWYLNPLDTKGNYSATSNNTKLVHWPLMGGLLHWYSEEGAWAGCSLTQSLPRCTKCNSPPINGQCTNHYCWWSVTLRFQRGD